MAHMIMQDDYMFSVRKVPWHGLGTVINQAPNSLDAIKLAKLEWEVIQKPLGLFDNQLPPQGPIPGYFANVRSDTNNVLGIVSNRYSIVQNKDAFAFTDELLGHGVKYETAGSLNNGKRVWILAKMPETIKILGDEVCPYLVFTHGHDGENGVRVAITPVRVVCNNTLNLALKNAQRSWSTSHIGNIHDRLDAASETLRLADLYLENLSRQAEVLKKQKLDKDTIAQFIDQLLPIPLGSGYKKQDNILYYRSDLISRYYNAKDLDEHRGTAWGFINAVTDFAAHCKPIKETLTHNENLFYKIVGGHTIVDKAYQMVSNL